MRSPYRQAGNCLPVSWLLVPLFSVTDNERPAMSVRFNVAGVEIAEPTCHAPYDCRDALVPFTLTDAIGVIRFSTKNSLLFPDLKRTLTLPLTGQGMNFQLVPLGLPTG